MSLFWEDEICPHRGNPFYHCNISTSTSLVAMPPKRAPAVWESAELELRLIRSGKSYYLKGYDASGQRIDHKLPQHTSSDTIEGLIAVSHEDAMSVMLALERHRSGVHTCTESISALLRLLSALSPLCCVQEEHQAVMCCVLPATPRPLLRVR